MARSIYVMPITGSGASRQDSRRPKYKDALFATLLWSMFDYGDEPWCVVGILDVPPQTDSDLDALADVFKLPDDLDQQLGAARTTVANRLEAVNMPGTWVLTTTSYREVVEFIGAVCQFMQRFQGISGIPAQRWFTAGRTLDTTFSQVPAAGQNAAIACFDSDWQLPSGEIVHLDRTSLSAASTLREILHTAGQQYLAAGLPIDLAGPL